jgi:hypothetical protein
MLRFWVFGWLKNSTRYVGTWVLEGSVRTWVLEGRGCWKEALFAFWMLVGFLFGWQDQIASVAAAAATAEKAEMDARRVNR